MPPGRPRKPIEVSRRQGNPGQRRLPEPLVILPAAPEGGPPYPEGLSEKAKLFWANIWTFGTVWMTPHFDPLLVEEAARTLDTLDELHDDVARNGAMIDDVILFQGQDTGFTKRVPNPAIRAANDTSKRLQQILAELGLTPSARARLGVAQVKAQTGLEKLAAMQRKP